MPTISVENHQLNYIAVGNPKHPAVLMLHGWGSYHGIWKNSIEALQNTHYCIAIDHLGFGDSDKPVKTDYSIRAQAGRALKVMDELGFSQFSIMGHSMGGQIGMYLASELAPERVTKLVNVDGVVTGKLCGYVRHVVYPTVRMGHILPMAYILPNIFLNAKWYARYLHGSWFYKMNSVPFASWETDRKMARQQAGAHSLYWAGQAIKLGDLTASLPKISAKTLIIFGKHDNTVPISDGELAHEHIPNNEIIWIDDCGHFPMYEKPQAYMEAITQFFGAS